ncbi:hypothetical protein G7046_g2653 [Stylonectria norvegica]|nr:hypothetical protein G7046_g2653 [Stylonectria norvegica]
MVPPTHASNDGISAVIDILNDAAQVCKRLLVWNSQLARAQTPLRTLICTQIEALDLDVHALLGEVLSLNTSSAENVFLEGHEATSLPAELLDRLYLTKLRTLETLDLLYFSSKNENHGHDGALNAMFASQHILSRDSKLDDTQLNGSYLNEDRLRRLGEDFVQTFRFIADDCSSVSKESAIVTFRKLEPTILDFFSRAAAQQLEPCYVHTYHSLETTPYNADPTSPLFKGGFGAVRRVHHKRTKESCAMKTVEYMFSDAKLQTILREIKVLEVCAHKNIVRLLEAFRLEQDGQSIHLIMSPWAPYTLWEFLHEDDMRRKKHCPWFVPGSLVSDECIFRIMYEISDAVDYLHGLPIKHKDIKPENILLHQHETSQVIPLITDVGTSKVYLQGASTDYIGSSFQYLAPEQIAERESSLKADMWQLGCCLAILLAVARGGTSAFFKLWNSFNTDIGTCQISTEHMSFMKTLDAICTPGNAAQRRAYFIVTRMMELNSDNRIDARAVRNSLRQLYW